MKLFPLMSADEMEEELYRRNRSTLHIPVVATAYALLFALILVYGPTIIDQWQDANGGGGGRTEQPDHNSY